MSRIISGLLRLELARLSKSTALCFDAHFNDGSRYSNHTDTPQVTLRFNSARSELRALLLGHVGLLDAFFDGELIIEGDLKQLFRISFESGFDSRPPLPVRWRNRWHEWRYSNSSARQACINARAHYGLGTEFYKPWLDIGNMMYTCAYWKEGTADLEQAQINKIEHVCRKILLQADDEVVDIGCGFGGFMFHAASEFGVRICGVNTTPKQVTYVRDEIERRNLQQLLEVREADFRAVHRQFDKVVSIGVLEHAGRDQLSAVVKAHADFLKPGGLGMLHFIGHVGTRDTDFWIRQHIFPGGWIPSLSDTLREMENCGLEILDMENLRRHYALTLDAWDERFCRHWAQIQQLDPQRFDQRFFRKWHTYLAACAEMFRSPHQHTNLFQITFSKGNVGAGNYPVSRAFLYEDEPAPARAASF